MWWRAWAAMKGHEGFEELCRVQEEAQGGDWIRGSKAWEGSELGQKGERDLEHGCGQGGAMLWDGSSAALACGPNTLGLKNTHLCPN